MATFNKREPHATIHGMSRAAFFQDGVYFDGAGEEIDLSTPEVPEVPKKKATKKKPTTDDLI